MDAVEEETGFNVSTSQTTSLPDAHYSPRVSFSSDLSLGPWEGPGAHSHSGTKRKDQSFTLRGSWDDPDESGHGGIKAWTGQE